jgi:nicotinate-nucleotide adenylyltransferase
MRKPPLVLFGGTFDPIHYGHLRTALELQEVLNVPRINLVPTGEPVHKLSTGASAFQRFEMVRLAIESEPALVADNCELISDEPCYTINTLIKKRAEVGADLPIVLVMGMDSLLGIKSWSQWQQLTDYGHLLIVARPGYEPEFDSELQCFIDQHKVEGLEALGLRPSGHLAMHQLTPMNVSATQVRKIIKRGSNPRFLIPDCVWDFIKNERLYDANER